MQQRRKREKDLNGGISPEKLVHKNHNNDDTTTDAGEEGDEYDDHDNEDDNDKDNDCDAMTEMSKSDSESIPFVKQEYDSDGGVDGGGGGIINRPASSTRSRRSSFFVGDEDSIISTTRSAAATTAMTSVATGRSSRTALPKIISRKNTNNISTPKNRTKMNALSPKVPVSVEYVNPHQVCRQIDELLTADLPINDDPLDDYIDDFDMPEIPLSTNDLILISTPKDFLDIVSSVAVGPLSYQSSGKMRKSIGLSSFMRCVGGVSLTGCNRKRRNNRTGWPSMPKRRSVVIKKEELECESSNTNTEAEDNLIINVSKEMVSVANDNMSHLGTDECTVDYALESTAVGRPANECRNAGGSGNFTSRDRQSHMFTSSSEKAENSDIFTVSSDSVDTADLAAAKNPIKDIPLTLKITTTAQELYEGKNKSEDTVQMKSSVLTSDESSADCTLAEMLKKQIGVDEEKPLATIEHDNFMTDDEDDDEDTDQKDDEDERESDQKDDEDERETDQKQDENDEDDRGDDDDDDDEGDDDDEYVSVSSNDGNDSSGIGDNCLTSTEEIVPISRIGAKKILQPIVRVRKIDNFELNRRVKLKVMPLAACQSTSPTPPQSELHNPSTAPPQQNSTTKFAATSATSAATTCRPATNLCAPKSSQFSPPKLRKPRGRWYRER